MCNTKYNDLDLVVRNCFKMMAELGIQMIYFSKLDLKSAFHILGISPGHRCYLIMKVRDPIMKSGFILLISVFLLG